ncbi:hypothetical protein ACIHJG_39350 [Streptomyces sp. NPDC052415]|uniref:hypothetical protein n=1 Tax=Streptomyces sp. NPDC052415 TaxID=3365690 RepID=UPI0037D0F997
MTEQAPLAAGERLTADAEPREAAVEEFATADIAAMREQGDLPALLLFRGAVRLQMLGNGHWPAGPARVMQDRSEALGSGLRQATRAPARAGEDA